MHNSQQIIVIVIILSLASHIDEVLLWIVRISGKSKYNNAMTVLSLKKKYVEIIYSIKIFNYYLDLPSSHSNI